jgi:hypothetical protein
LPGIETETGDDFILAKATLLTSGSLTGLIPAGLSLSDVQAINIEIYRVFPNDSVNPPLGNVPTRVNSPSDIAFTTRDSSSGSLNFVGSILNGSFTAANSVLNGISPSPDQTTGGEGPVTGQEARFDFTFDTPLELPAGHYFFVPQVDLNEGDFFWLSAPKPTEPPFDPDLQTWIRNDNLEPDWLRVGTDIIGGPAHNASFSLEGSGVPETCSTLSLLASACLGIFGFAEFLRH